MKKKLCSLLLILALVLSFSACSTPSPTEVTTAFLQAVKEQNTEDMAGLYAEGSWSLSEEAGEEADLEEDDELSQYFMDEVFPKLLEFDYEVLEEKIDGEKAAVDVKITTYNLGDIFTAFVGEYLAQAFALAFSDADEDAITALGTSLFKEKTADMEKTYTETVSIPLSQVDGAWVVDEIDEESPFINALTGGLVDAADTLENSFEK